MAIFIVPDVGGSFLECTIFVSTSEEYMAIFEVAFDRWVSVLRW